MLSRQIASLLLLSVSCLLGEQLAEAGYQEDGGGDFEGVAGDEWDDAQRQGRPDGGLHQVSVPEGAEGVAGGDAEEHAECEADGCAVSGASARCWVLDYWV